MHASVPALASDRHRITLVAASPGARHQFFSCPRRVFHQGRRSTVLGAHTGTEIFMAAFARIRLVMLSGVACSILAACGADGVASPGERVNVIPAPTPTPATPPTPTPTPPPVTPADPTDRPSRPPGKRLASS